jgi:hypothetical protein
MIVFKLLGGKKKKKLNQFDVMTNRLTDSSGTVQHGSIQMQADLKMAAFHHQDTSPW